jgi:acetyl esterase/lipase
MYHFSKIKKMKPSTIPLLIVVLLAFLSACTGTHDHDEQYRDFLTRLEAEEAYIGFFAAEKTYISERNESYLKARRSFFLGVDQCREDPDSYIEAFIRTCRKQGVIEEQHVEAWEKVLTILSFELYANRPIYEFAGGDVREIGALVFAQYPDKTLELDLFLPETPVAEPLPAVVCIHGGGFVVNRRIWFEPFARYLADKGLAAVTIDYRKIPAVGIMECVQDAKAAVRWLRAHASDYGIDPGRIGALGASAGAFLVANLATTAHIPELEGAGGNAGVSSEIQAVVGIATPAMKLDNVAEDFLWFGLSLEEARLLSPHENVSPASAPLFLIHGTADETVEPGNASALYEKYKEMGAPVDLKWIPDEGHGFYEGTDLGIAMAAEYFLKTL